MMNLRDLIYGDALSSEVNSIELVDENPNSNSFDATEILHENKAKKRTRQIITNNEGKTARKMDVCIEKDNEEATSVLRKRIKSKVEINNDNISINPMVISRKSPYCTTFQNFPHLKSLSSLPKVYRFAPEVLQAEHGPTLFPKYAPGLQSYLVFPQDNEPLLKTNQKMLRALWEQTIYGGDLEGALEVIKVLCNIGSIEMDDFKRFCEIMEASNNGIAAIKQLARFALTKRLHAKLYNINKFKSEVISLFISIFIIYQDMNFIDELLNIGLEDTKCSQSKIIKSLRASFICIRAIEYVHKFHPTSNSTKRTFTTTENHENISNIAFTASINTTPSYYDITRNPLLFSSIIKIISQKNNNNSSQSLESHISNDKRKLLRDIPIYLLESIRVSPENPTMHGLYAGYLQGIGQSTQAMKFLISSVKENSSSIQLIQLLVTHSCIFTPCSRFIISRMIQLIERTLIPHNDTYNNGHSLHMLLLLFRLRILINNKSMFSPHPKPTVTSTPTADQKDYSYIITNINNKYLSTLAVFRNILNCVESLNPPSELFTHYERKSQEELLPHSLPGGDVRVRIWLLWQLVANILGPLPTKIELYDDVNEESEIARKLPSLIKSITAKKRNTINSDIRSTHSENYLSNDQSSSSSANTSSSVKKDEMPKSNILSSKDTCYEDRSELISELRKSRKWWCHTLFSPHLLGEIVSGITEATAKDILTQAEAEAEDLEENQLGRIEVPWLQDQAIVSQRDIVNNEPVPSSSDPTKIDVSDNEEDNDSDNIIVSSNNSEGEDDDDNDDDNDDDDDDDDSHQKVANPSNSNSNSESENESKQNVVTKNIGTIAVSKNSLYDTITIASKENPLLPSLTTLITSTSTIHNQPPGRTAQNRSVGADTASSYDQCIVSIEKIWQELIRINTGGKLQSIPGDLPSELLHNNLLTSADFSVSSGIYPISDNLHLPKTSHVSIRYLTNGVRYRILGKSLLQILTYQIMICAHLMGPDNIFCARATQILVQHAKKEKIARSCIVWLTKNNFNVIRAIRVASMLLIEEVNIFTAPPRSCQLTDEFPVLIGTENTGVYCPINFK